MPNYQNSKIYVIRSHQTDDIYIGSTCNELRKRLWRHKADYKLYQQGKCHYISSFNIIKYDDAYIELYEKYECNDKMELLKREGEIIRQLKCVNKIQSPGIYLLLGQNTYLKKYRENNKNVLKQKRISYKIKNKEKIKQNKTKIINCLCGSSFQKTIKARHNKSLKHRIFMFNLHNELNHL